MSKSGIETSNENGELKSKRQGSSRPFAVGGDQSGTAGQGPRCCNTGQDRTHHQEAGRHHRGKNSYGSDPNLPKDKN